jgi:hypothetical protein
MARRLASQVAQQWMGVTLGLLALIVALGGTVMAHGGDATQVHACTEDGNTIRANTLIVAPDGSCPAGWTAKDWSVQGPVGPKGDAGAPGEPGAQGPQGAAGEAGPAAAGTTPDSDPSFGAMKKDSSIVAKLLPPGSKTYVHKSPKNTSIYKTVQVLCPAERPNLVSGGFDLDGLAPADVTLAMNQAGLFGWGAPFKEGWQTIAIRKAKPGPLPSWALKVTAVCKKK